MRFVSGQCIVRKRIFCHVLSVIVLAGLVGSLGAERVRAQDPVTTVENDQGTILLRLFENGDLELFDNGSFTAPGVIESTGGGFLLPDGTLLDESGDLGGGLSLPFSSTTSASSDLMDITQTGSGRAGRFAIDKSDSFIEAVLASSNGSGNALKGLNTGTGRAGLFQVLNENSGANALEATTNGTGRAAHFSITNVENGNPALLVETAGIGRTALFRIANASNGAEAVRAETNGGSHAGVFQIDNTENDSSAVQGQTNGTGHAVQGVQRGTGRAGDFQIYGSSSGAAALRAETNGIGRAGLFRIVNANSGAEAVRAETNGGSHAGVFQIENAENDSSAVQGQTNGSGHAVQGIQRGTGHAGDFQIYGSSSDAAALRAETNGTGFVADLSASQTGTGAGNNPAGNVARIANFGGQGADVLALQAGPSTPGTGVNYLSFYDESGTSVGAVEGNGSGGVQYKTSGSDYAESLPVASGARSPEPADLVGVRGGAVGLKTTGAERLMVVTGQAAVLGNAPSSPETERARRVPVAFVGQVPVKVRGAAETGDLIVASGKEDGTARAVPPSDYRPAKHGSIAGQAWSEKSTSEVGTVTVAVGLSQSGAVVKRLQDQQDQIDSLRGRVRALEDVEKRQEGIAKQVAALKDQQSGFALAGGRGLPLLAVLLGIGGFGAGYLWRRRR